MLNKVFYLSAAVVFLFVGCTKKQMIKQEIITPVTNQELSSIEKEPSSRYEDWQATKELETVYFDFESSGLSEKAKTYLAANAKYLKSLNDYEILVAGNCCECGTNEYNLSMGQQRAEMVKKYYSLLGIHANNISTISYGEEKPVNPNAGPPDSINCKKNRRAETKIRIASVTSK
ncbi:MAG: hypothetical protein A2252_03775 [Elusimicrobia bacterium RIFOXYA2_FULL_39_19]|nr:MAG: hypothetical protein A2252_03775 [Elusimicrobia bacterium RIFOXYA2_FULL_39_19]